MRQKITDFSTSENVSETFQLPKPLALTKNSNTTHSCGRTAAEHQHPSCLLTRQVQVKTGTAQNNAISDPVWVVQNSSADNSAGSRVNPDLPGTPLYCKP